MAADFQCKYQNPCRLAREGHFGSKFATVVVTGSRTTLQQLTQNIRYTVSCTFLLLFSVGNSANEIHTEGYQVSDQCMALVRDSCLIPTLDAPELAYVKESTNEQYVPDVFYKVFVPATFDVVQYMYVWQRCV